MSETMSHTALETTETLEQLIAEAADQSRGDLPTPTEVEEDQNAARAAQYEDMIKRLMVSQGIGRRQAKRAIAAHSRRVVKKFYAAQHKQSKLVQKRKAMGLEPLAPLTPYPEAGLLDGVTADNIHPEILAGEPVGNEAI